MLNKKMQALAFLALTLSGLSVIFYDSYYKAQTIAQKIATGELGLDVEAIRREIDTVTGVVDPVIITGITVSIGVLWLVGIVDCFRLGRKYQSSAN